LAGSRHVQITVVFLSWSFPKDIQAAARRQIGPTRSSGRREATGRDAAPRSFKCEQQDTSPRRTIATQIVGPCPLAERASGST
jgi:hypothetical protein